MRRKSFSFVVSVTIFLSLSVAAFAQKNDLYSQIELFSYALTTVQAAYVDEPTAKDLIYGSLQGMLSSLDPHSQFLTPEDYQNLKVDTEGRFGGLGIEISIRDNLLTVITPIEGTPAWRAGIKALDKIIKIDDESTKDITLSEAVKKLRGTPNTKVDLTIFRESEGRIVEITVTREIIHIENVKDAVVLKDGIAYLRLTEFREESHKDFKKAIKSLKDQDANAIILDLRNNPGGLLNAAIDITQEFLPEGKVIVSTKSRNPAQNTVSYSNNKNGDYLSWPMVVLINEGSASGSEILAGALKDNQRAIIVGTKSFGKGSVQSVIPLPDGAGLKLTTSKYFTPSGESIHEIGIEPDVVVERESQMVDGETLPDLAEEIFKTIESEEDKDDKKEESVQERLLNDNQVMSAFNILKGIRVYQRQ